MFNVQQTLYCALRAHDFTVVCIAHQLVHKNTIQQFYVLPTQCIYVFCVDLRTNSDYFPIQH
jgi:hypothetical protein